MFKDTSHNDQPQDAVRFAKNAVTQRTSGAYTNEAGTKALARLLPGSVIIGAIAIENESVVLFSKYGNRSTVSIFSNGQINVILNLVVLPIPDTNLNLQVTHGIEGVFRLQSDGDMVIYWTDNLNPPRTLNLTRQKRSSEVKLYGIDPIDSSDRKFIDRLNLFPHTGPIPKADFKGVFMGGGLMTGVYYLCLGYTDLDNTTTPFSTVANPVPIVDAPEHVVPIESYDGSKPNVLSGKSIKWEVSNINTDMEYLSVGIIIIKGGEETALRLNDINISGRSSFSISFENESAGRLASVDELVIDPPHYETAKTIAQLDNTLYVGNLSGSLDLGYQCYANNIKSCAAIKPLNPFDPWVMNNDFLEKKKGGTDVIENGYRDPLNIVNYKGYTRNEIYAFYIGFVLNNGRMSYAYHIPGREPLENINTEDLTEDVRDHDGASFPTGVNENQLQNSANNRAWDVIGKAGKNQSMFFHWYDFSMLTPTGMNYWENMNEFYPDSDDFNVCDAENPGVIGNQLRPQGNNGNPVNVRHHKFASNVNADLTTIKDSNASELEVQTTRIAVVHWYWFGGIDNEPDKWTLRGKWGNDDAQAAQDWQAGISPVGMGETQLSLPPGFNNPEIFGNNAWSCLPEGNTRLLRFIQENKIGCNDYDEIEWQYDSNMPEGVEAVICYDPPSLGDQLGELWRMAPACGFMGIGTSTEAEANSVRIESVTWEHSVITNQYFPTPVTSLSRNDEPIKSWDPRPGWAAWVECEDRVVSTAPIEHEVQALGICLSDIKIPKEIADKVQGFKIFYAKRTHENRTVLGQSILHGMKDRESMDISGCDSEGDTVGLIDYWLASGLPVMTTENEPRQMFGFHDFYLLNRTMSLANATHVRLQYVTSFFNWSGTTSYYPSKVDTDEENSDNVNGSCYKPQVLTSFHAAGDFFRKKEHLNKVLENKGRAYVVGGTIYDSSQIGFQKAIYNVGGETLIALRTQRNLEYLVSPENAAWRTLRSDHSNPLFHGPYLNTQGEEGREDGLQLYTANLQAFKTDVFSPLDTQDLVWTGYEVLGDDLDKFVVDKDGNSIYGGPDKKFQTDDIYGGDTYICRYGYRMTHREEVNSTGEPNMGSIDHKSVMYTIVESTENINFRHIDSQVQVESSVAADIEEDTNNRPYFPGASLSDTLKPLADVDLTYNPDLETGNIKYNEDYSRLNDIKKILPLPLRLIQPVSFPTTVIRSAQTSANSVIDNFRLFQYDEIAIINNQRGELWKMISLDNMLLFHMENSLYKTKGKQKMKTSDEGDAYIGQGDIFAQTPDEIVHTDAGYLGTRSQWAGTVTPHGYFCVDNRNARVFLVGKGAEDLTGKRYGMEQWFRLNLPFYLQEYGFDGNIDQPVNGMGVHAIWDERYQRVIMTKKDLKPTQLFLDNFVESYTTTIGSIRAANGNFEILRDAPNFGWKAFPIKENEYFKRADWTVSFVTNRSEQGVGVWESFHDYTPLLYTHSGIDIHSFNQGNEYIHRHNNDEAMGVFYGERYNFEVEMVHNQPAGVNKLYSSLEYLVDVYDNVNGKFTRKDLHAGFNNFIIYNSDANSGDTLIEYMINVRKTEGRWKINQFRDMSSEIANVSPYYVGPHAGGNYNIPNVNLSGGITNEVPTTANIDMFNIEGMNEDLNPNYIDPTKVWYKQGKFTDLFLAVRLISNNSDNKLINLYNSFTNFRPQER